MRVEIPTRSEFSLLWRCEELVECRAGAHGLRSPQSQEGKNFPQCVPPLTPPTNARNLRQVEAKSKRGEFEHSTKTTLCEAWSKRGKTEEGLLNRRSQVRILPGTLG